MCYGKAVFAVLCVLGTHAMAGEPDQGALTPYQAAKEAEDRTFALRRKAEEAELLARWCATGFGPVDQCARQQRPGSGDTPPPVASMPTTFQTPPPGVAAPSSALSENWGVSIIGWDDKPMAWVRPPGGSERKITRTGIEIDGWRVDSLSKAGIELSRPELTRGGEPVTDESGAVKRRRLTLLPSRQNGGTGGAAPVPAGGPLPGAMAPSLLR
jgi:hypothetical protein